MNNYCINFLRFPVNLTVTDQPIQILIALKSAKRRFWTTYFFNLRIARL